jgi:hypothetical protein
MNDTRRRCRQSKLLNPHRPPPCYFTEDAPRDRSIRLLDGSVPPQTKRRHYQDATFARDGANVEPREVTSTAIEEKIIISTTTSRFDTISRPLFP